MSFEPEMEEKPEVLDDSEVEIFEEARKPEPVPEAQPSWQDRWIEELEVRFKAI